MIKECLGHSHVFSCFSIFPQVRECFVETRENLLSWLADVDARLDLVDRLPDLNVTEKIRRVRVRIYVWYEILVEVLIL